MESIKQEIVNNVYENGEQLITGPVLQEVLLDIVDDYNGKIRSGSVPQDLVGKTGSWDDAADWVEQNSSSVVLQSDLEGYATEDWVEDQGYLKEHQDISGLATTQSLNELSESVAQSIADIPEVDLSGYATTESVETLVNETSESVKEWVEAQRYLTSASLSGSVTEETVGFMINDATASVKEWVEDKNYATETFVSESIAGLDIPSTEGFATTESLNQLSESVAETIANLPQADLSGYLTTASYTADSASFDERINAITGSDLSGYATTESLNQLSESVANDLAGLDIPDVSGLATTESVIQLSESVAESFENLPEVDLSGYATTSSVNEATSSVKEWVEEQGYLTEHQDISGLATTESVNSLSQSVAESIENIDLSEYATTSSVESSISEATESVKEWVEAQRYLTTASLSGSVTEESVQYMINDATSSVKDWVGDQNYATETFVSESIAAIPGTDLTGYATEAWVQEQGYLTEHQDISGLATTSSVIALSESVAQTIEDLPEADLSGYVTTASYNTDSASFDERINAITGSDLSGYATTESLNALSESVYGYEIDNLWNAVNALEDAEIIAWDDENEEYTAVPLSASVSAISESLVVVANKVGEKANAGDLTSLSESVATDLGLLDERVTEVEETKVDEEGVYNVLAGTGLAESEYGEWIVYGAAKENDLREVSSSLSASIAAITESDLSGYATTESVSNLSESVAESIASIQVPDVSGFLPTSSYLVDSASFDQRIDSIVVPDVSGLATTESVNQLSSSFDERINNIITGSGVDLSGYATTASLNSVSESLSSDLEDLSGRVGTVEEDLSYKVDWDAYDTERAEFSQSVASDITELSESIAAITGSDLSGYATTQSVNDLSSSVGTISSSFAETIANIPTGSSPDLSGYATTESVNSLSESVASDFANLDIPDVSIYTPTASFNPVSASFNDVSQSYKLLNRFLFGTQSIYDGDDIELSAIYSNWNWEISGSELFPLASGLGGDGHSIEVFVHNVGTDDVTVSFNREYTYATYTLQSIVNGVVGPGSFTIPAGEYGDIVVTKMDSRLFFRTSLDVEVPEVDLSGYATTASLNSVSESLSASIAAITSSGGGSGDYLPLTGGTINNPEEGSTLLTVAGVDGGGIDIGANNGPETEESTTGDGESWIDLYGSSGEELIIHNRGFIEYNWENEGDYGNVSLNLPKIEGEDTLAVLGDITALSESVSQSIAAITSSGGGSGTDTDLRNYLFGVVTQQVTGITGSVTNIFTSISQNSTLGFSGVPDEGRSLSITVHNTAASTSTITLPESVVVGSDTFNLINNGVDDSGSMSIPAGEYGDIVVTRHGSNIYVRTSVNLDDINVDLSGYATTSSLNSVSESLSASIAAITSSGGESGDYLPLAGGTLTAGEESDATVLELTAPDGGGGHMTLEVSNNPENPDWPGYGGSSLIIGGNDGEVILHDGPYIDYSWKNGEDEFVSATINFPEIDGDDTLAIRGDITSLSESISQSIANIPAADLSSYATTASVTQLSESVAQSIANISISSGSPWLLGDDGTGAKTRVIPGDDPFIINWSDNYSISASIAEGNWVSASGNYSHAEGFRTKAQKQYSHAEGYQSIASGSWSHAEGDNTVALGQGSHAEGISTTASGDWSHAEGINTVASGQHSHAEGNETIASNTAEHAQGKWNAAASSQIFSVGVGDSTIRKNAISIITGSGAVPNASIYILGIGGYDGTNPNPGVNDIASVISSLTARIAALEGN